MIYFNIILSSAGVFSKRSLFLKFERPHFINNLFRSSAFYMTRLSRMPQFCYHKKMCIWRSAGLPIMTLNIV
jgi:hypothetical protein